MHRIDGPGHVGGAFVSEDLALGRAPTLVTPEWLNAVQEELIQVIQAAMLTPSKGNAAQVLEALRLLFGDGPGRVDVFALQNAPAGYLKANGAAVSRQVYGRLFSAVGTRFGTGDGSTTFNLPDLRGEFFRGWDDGRGVDPGRQLGSFQGDAFQGHRRNLVRSSGTANGDYIHGIISAAAGSGVTAPAATADGDTWVTRDYLTEGSFGFPRVAAETRGRNVALLACIKF